VPKGIHALPLPRCTTCKKPLNYRLSWTTDGDYVRLSFAVGWVCLNGHKVGTLALAPHESVVEKWDLIPSQSDEQEAQR